MEREGEREKRKKKSKKLYDISCEIGVAFSSL